MPSWCLAGATVLLADVEKFDFSRYQSILDRKPFGQPRAAAALTQPAAAPAPPEPPFTRDLRLCALVEDEVGVKVGFIDISAKPVPRSWFLRVGDSTEDGITVEAADFDREGALLVKEGRKEWIYMSQAGSAQVPQPTPGPTPTPFPQRMGLGPPGMGGPPPAGAAAARMSYAERLKSRREALLVKPAEPPRLSGEELRKHLEQYQMDLIRKGMPALPIPLTKEMDDQLVAEGVLPPLEAATQQPGQ